MRLVQAFEAVFLFGFRFARPTRERRGRYAGFFPGMNPASARLTVTQTSCRITIFTRQTRNTYTTPIPLEAHRGSHIITSGLACNTVKHETAVVASFIVFVTHRRIVPRDARPSARDPRRRRRSGCSAYNRDALRLRPATSRAIRIFTRFSPDSTCCMLVGQSGRHQSTRLAASFAPLRVRGPAESPAPAGGGGGRGAWDTYRDTTGTSTAVLWLHLSLSTSRHSSALTYMVQGSTQSSYHSHTCGTLTAQHSDGTQHSHRHHAHAHGTTQGERMGGESARCRRVTREGAWPAAAVAPPGASTPLDAP